MLAELCEIAAKNLREAFQICEEHEGNYPSPIAFWVSVVSGFGGLLILEPTFASIVMTIGGALGAGISIYQRGEHLMREQGYLGLYWRADMHRSALAVELMRRGIRY